MRNRQFEQKPRGSLEFCPTKPHLSLGGWTSWQWTVQSWLTGFWSPWRLDCCGSCRASRTRRLVQFDFCLTDFLRSQMAVGQHQWYHFGVGAPAILVYFSGDWDVHWGYGVLTHSQIAPGLHHSPHFPADVPRLPLGRDAPYSVGYRLARAQTDLHGGLCRLQPQATRLCKY